MSDEQALVPVAEKQVNFYGDELTAALVDVLAFLGQWREKSHGE